MLAELSRILRFYTWLVLACGAAAAILGLFAVERLALTRLTRLAHEVESITDDAAGGVSDYGDDELGILGKSIHRMLGRIRENRVNLEKNHRLLACMNENLESIVGERTAELRAKAEILEHALTGIAQLDERGRVVCPNGAFALMFGGRVEEVAGKDWRELVDDEDLTKARLAYEQAVEQGRAETEIVGRKLNGNRFHGQVVLVSAKDQFGYPSIHCFLKDITDQKALEAKIRHQAFHDHLTGLPNRMLLQDRVQLAIRRMKRSRKAIALLFIDLDNFKYVNDSMGHDVGDQLLKLVAGRIRSSLRPDDSLARLGGDEFTVLMENLYEAEEVVETANRIVEALREPIRLGHRELFVTMSIGVVINYETEVTADELFRDADTALNQAKESGKNRVALFHPGMNHRVVERLEMESALRKAVEQSRFSVLYQPIIDVRTGSVAGAEALIRWRDPVRGTVPPAKFIPIAEETGLIEPIGRLVMLEACKQGRRWLDAHPSFCMSVNVSMKQFQRPDFASFVSSVLAETGLPPEHLKLEITESVLLEDGETIIERLNELKSLGVKLALDDFGTGYSSLSYLRWLPVDTVKIDRSFMSVLGIEEQPTAIVKAIVMLCNALDLTITGEGIETAEQLSEIQKLGCQYAQGYHFSAPLCAEAFEDFLFRADAA